MGVIKGDARSLDYSSYSDIKKGFLHYIRVKVDKNIW